MITEQEKQLFKRIQQRINAPIILNGDFEIDEQENKKLKAQINELCKKDCMLETFRDYMYKHYNIENEPQTIKYSITKSMIIDVLN